MDTRIDVTFDFRTHTPRGKDPDARSPTLRKYHKTLWTKPLPSGVMFELDDTTRGAYLHHRSALGEFWLSSDSVIPTFSREKRLSDIFETIPDDERTAFETISYTIGGMMLFPANCINRKMTLNGARGCHPRIKDRFDLTVECIRRHYKGEDSPLSATIARYSNFFGLFGDFQGFVEFFLLQDLVTPDCSAVNFSMPFDDFKGSPLPASRKAYDSYRDRAVEFIQSRNDRILAWCEGR